MKIFLDDIRCPKDCLSYMHERIGSLNPIYGEGEWFIVRNYDQFMNALIRFNEIITHVSFDHDLADEHYVPEEYWDDFNKSKEHQDRQEYKEKTGEHCAIALKEFYENINKTRPIMFVHSMNPVGTEKIINVFKTK